MFQPYNETTSNAARKATSIIDTHGQDFLIFSYLKNNYNMVNVKDLMLIHLELIAVSKTFTHRLLMKVQRKLISIISYIFVHRIIVSIQ